MPATKTSLERMRMANERADISLRSHLEELGKNEKISISVLDKESIQLRMELRANRSRELSSLIRQELEKAKQEKPRQPAIRVKRSNVRDIPRNKKGSVQFHKLTTDTLQNGSSQPRIRRYLPIVDIGEDSKKTEDSDNGVQQTVPATCHANGNGKNNIKAKKTLKSRPISEPTYIKILKSIQSDHYDQYTDGTMALAMRRFHYRQREMVPVMAGYLTNKRKPCKREVPNPQNGLSQMSNTSLPLLQNTPKPQQKESKDSEAPSQSDTRLPSLHPCQNKFYIPKHLRAGTRNDDEEEHKKLLKIRRADETETYRKSLERLNSFLGRAIPRYTIDSLRLSQEETLLLEKLKSSYKSSGACKHFQKSHTFAGDFRSMKPTAAVS